MSNEPRRAGRHFLQIPGPTPVPDRVLRAMDMPMVDHRGPEFQKIALKALAGIKGIMGTKGPVYIFPSSGTGAWEAALANTLSPGDHVLMVETGQFATLWQNVANRLGLVPELIATDWRTGARPAEIEARLKDDKGHAIKAVCIVHNETATGCVTDVAAVRKAIDAAGHPALLMVDTISSLGSMDYQHDGWGVDVTIAGAQKGLMLPPGMAFNGVSDKALAAAKTAKLPRAYFSWEAMAASNATGFFPYTPAIAMLYGLIEACNLLQEEGLENAFARHRRLGEATRRAVKAWGLEILCREPDHCSSTVTAILMPAGMDADAFRKVVLDNYDVSLGTGLGKVAGKVFRIGHLGDTNDLTVLAAIAGVEMSLGLAGVPHKTGGVQAAMAYLAEQRAAAAKTGRAA